MKTINIDKAVHAKAIFTGRKHGVGEFISMETYLIPSNSSINYNEKWNYIDDEGHQHEWVINDKGEPELETAVSIEYVTGPTWDHNYKTRFYCKECDEEILVPSIFTNMKKFEYLDRLEVEIYNIVLPTVGDEIMVTGKSMPPKEMIVSSVHSNFINKTDLYVTLGLTSNCLR